MRIFLCPALIDWILFLVMFAVLYGAGERGMSITQCAWIGIIVPLTYMITSLMIGILLSLRNARIILCFSTFLCIILGTVCIILRQFAAIMLAVSALGFVVAIFFNAFQAFMRGESAPSSLARATGFYTLAWSLGAGAGLCSAGFLYQLGSAALIVVNVLAGTVVLMILLTHRSKPQHAPSVDDHVERTSFRPPNPAYVWIGWIIIFTIVFIQRPVHTFFPAICARTGISPFLASLPLFAMMLVQGLFGFCMIYFCHILYKKIPIWIFHGTSAIILLFIWKWPIFPVCFIGITLLGIYAGFAFFCAVYYANASGHHSFNVGVNECLVGLGSLTGLFLCQWVMIQTNNNNSMYMVCAIVLLISTAVQSIIAFRAGKKNA